MKNAIIGTVSSILTLIFVILGQKGCELEKLKHEPVPVVESLETFNSEVL